MVDVATTQRLEKLRREINYHNHRYYVLNDPVISDDQYDMLMRDLRKLEAEHPELVISDSPTQRIGAAPAEGFPAVEHLVPLLSLGNAFNVEELRDWYRRAQELLEGASFEMVCELKIDGLAVALTYEDGRMVRGATRGDGFRGEDVTQSLRTVRSIPLTVTDEDVPHRLEVRGEVYLPKSAFQRLNEERIARGEPGYANPRNTAAGSLRQLDPQVTASRPLDIFVYAVGYTEGGGMPDNHWDALERLKVLGFKANSANCLCRTLEEVEEYYQKWLEGRENLDYAVDGVVVKISPFSFQQHLGVVGREPRWAIAYKFPATQAVTRLVDIGINVGRTGTLNPYAMLEPVNVGGAAVKLATLHNEDDIRRKDIRIGDWVTVERAGEVIPRVVAPVVARRTGQERYFFMPSRCPTCDESVIRPKGEAMTYCVNTACPAQFARLLMHFVDRSAMDIRGLGEKLTRALIEAKLVRDIADVYAITSEQFMSMERMAEKSASTLINTIERSKSRPLPNVVTALGIRHVGLETAEVLVRHFGSMGRIARATKDELVAVPGIGPTIAESIVAHFGQEANQRVLDKLRKAGVRLESLSALQKPRSLPLAGRQLVVTGRLSSMSRSQAEDRIKELGGSGGSSVSKKTAYLVAGEEPGSKLDQATKLGTRILDEDEFLKLLEILGEGEA